MIDLERFHTIPEDKEVLWNIWSKVGDTCRTDRGLKDGDLTQIYPAEHGIGIDGIPYGTIGERDLTDYVIVQARANKTAIRELFREPYHNSKAYKRRRKNNYYLHLDKLFDHEDLLKYRDHGRPVPIIRAFDLSKISDYRKTPDRLKKAFVSGSVISGDYTYGAGGSGPLHYTDKKTAADAIGAVGSNTINFECIGANSPGADIDFDKVTNLDGLIRFFSTQYGFRSNPVTNAGGKWFRLDGSCNITFEDLTIENHSFHYDKPTTGSTGRTHIFRRLLLVKGTNKDPFYPNIDKAGTPITIKFYGNLIIMPVGATGNQGNWIPVDSSWGTTDWNEHIFIENNTLIGDYAYAEGAILITGANNGYVFQNNVIYQSTGTISWKELLAGGCVLNNCARNLAVSGTFTENDCITDLVSGDFIAVSGVDAGKIDIDSRLYATGKDTGNIPEFDRDIIGGYLSEQGPSMGAFLAAFAPPEPMDPNPEIYFNNLLAGESVTLTATSELDGFPIENITLEALLYDWQATSTANQVLTADCGSAVTASRVLLSGNFIDLEDVGVKIETSTNGSDWDVLAYRTQQIAGPVLLSVPETSARYWRVTLSGLTTAPVIGHWGIYDPLIAPRKLGDGSDLYRAKDNSVTHTTETGRDQMHTGPIMREGRLLLGNILEGGAVADKVDELREFGRTGKIFICLNPEEAPEDVFYALLTRSIMDPIVGQTRKPKLDYREVK